MTFNEWLQEELNKRGWSQLELLSRMGEYQISQAQLSRILNGVRDAGPEACIGIANAFGISREEIFRIRGWLQYDIDSNQLDLNPEVVRFAIEIDSLSDLDRELVLEAGRAVTKVLRQHRASSEELSDK